MDSGSENKVVLDLFSEWLSFNTLRSTLSVVRAGDASRHKRCWLHGMLSLCLQAGSCSAGCSLAQQHPTAVCLETAETGLPSRPIHRRAALAEQLGVQEDSSTLQL